MPFHTVSFVVPVHNEGSVVERTVTEIVERLRGFPGSEVILVENGSVDLSPQLVRRLAGELSCADVSVVATESDAGLGHALRRGIEVSTGDLVVLTAADLPFGFSDFDQVVDSQRVDQVVDSQRVDQVVIGSKAHPDTRYAAPPLRRAMSAGFRVLRRALLGLRVGDSQGTFLVPGPWVRSVSSRLRSGDYLVTTELALLADLAGLSLREIPVVGRAVTRPSSVRPVRDSWRMLLGLVRLSRRLARERRLQDAGVAMGGSVAA